MLADAGHKVTVVGLEPQFIAYWRGPQISVSQEGKIKVWRLRVPSWPIGFRFFERVHYRLLAKKLKKRGLFSSSNPELIHAHSIYPGLLFAAALRSESDSEVPMLLTEHRPSSIKRPTSGFRGRAIKQAVQECAQHIVVSTPFAKILKSHWDSNDWAVIGLPVPDKFFSQKHYENPEPVILHVSSLDENKAPSDLLKAAKQLASSGQKFRLRIVGGAPELIDSLKQQSIELGIENITEFVGKVSREQIPEEMASADLFVLPSITEAGGTVLSEAQAAGTPVVATKTWAGEYSVLPETGRLAEISNPDSLAKALEEVLSGIKTGHYQREVIRKTAETRFSEKAFVKQHENVYQKALELTKKEDPR
ncbi:hypothetical protein BSR29_00810 [Boudabousia liubingyangii]|uniref:Glycosyltransferase n=2 Tax=Boudabousia liubingyangii TaxID=1921764 RepID=A0A1Q5PQ01_9ACTO|nr:hypothetical protein BSR29_00810 [Boudabousia liubingyangii]